MLKSKITVNLEHHKALKKVLDGVPGPATQEMLEYWSKTYRSFVMLRFDIFSSGGGNWRRNTPTTQRRKGHNRILEDTREMRTELANGIGEISRDELSITMGFTNEKQHSNANLNISELATIHDQGMGVPKRRILVLPTDSVLRTLRGGTTKRMAKIANGEK